jgi:precorrin-6B methylase 1
VILNGERVQVVDRGDEHYGDYGTVTREEHLGILTGRPMVEVLIDGNPHLYDIGFYVEQLQVEHSLRVPA